MRYGAHEARKGPVKRWVLQYATRVKLLYRTTIPFLGKILAVRVDLSTKRERGSKRVINF